MLQASSSLVSLFLKMQNGALSPQMSLSPLSPLLSAPAASSLATAPGEAPPAQPLSLVAGQTVSASILTRLAPQLYLAHIDGNVIQLKLPVQAEPGERLSLRVLKAAPDYVLQLLPAPAAAPGVSASLSTGAQIVQLVLSEPVTIDAGPARRPGLAPLISAPPRASSTPSEQELAIGMRKSVSQSGVFYESHLADWAQGRRPLASLRAEPQGSWPLSATSSGEETHSDGMVRSAPLAASTLTDEARAMLRQQLDTLETREFAWQGCVWPGQDAGLRIREEAHERNADAQEVQASTWCTSLKLTLAGLGELRVNLTSRGDSVTAAMAVDSVAAAETLYAGLPQLEERLLCAGLKPTSLKVVSHG